MPSAVFHATPLLPACSPFKMLPPDEPFAPVGATTLLPAQLLTFTRHLASPLTVPCAYDGDKVLA
eukprot:3956758-Amphidinium_carterae.1